MKDIARPGRSVMIFFDKGDKVLWRRRVSSAAYHATAVRKAVVIETKRTRVVIEIPGRKPFPVPNMELTHDPEMYK